MADLVERLRAHIQVYLDHINIDREAFESDGLGLRPISVAEKTEKSSRAILARRYYRLAQWTEVMQGADWLTVRRYEGEADSRTRSLRSIDTTRLAISLMTSGKSAFLSVADARFNGAYSLAQAAMNVFESNGYDPQDAIAVNNYGE